MEAPSATSVSTKAWKRGDQEDKRRKRLSQQKLARSRVVEQARVAAPRHAEDEAAVVGGDGLSCVMQFEESGEADGVGRGTSVKLSLPEQMLERPHDLEESWLCAAKPSGTRCLVQVSAKSKCTSTSLTGALLHTFAARLPAGTILDCIFSPPTRTFVVLDCLAWRGQQYEQGTEFEFRQFWLNNKLSEGDFRSEFQFSPLQFLACDRQGLEQARLYAQLDLNRDGVIFFHKEADYDVGHTPPLLQWSDLATSSGLADMTSSGEQIVFLEPRVPTTTITTIEEECIEGVALFTLEGFAVASALHAAQLPARPDGGSVSQHHRLLAKCIISGVRDDDGQGHPCVDNLRIVEIQYSQDVLADSWSKIYSDRATLVGQALLTFDQLL